VGIFNVDHFGSPQIVESTITLMHVESLGVVHSHIDDMRKDNMQTVFMVARGRMLMWAHC